MDLNYDWLKKMSASIEQNQRTIYLNIHSN